METKEFLIQMNKVPHVSAYEDELTQLISAEFSKYAKVSVDKFGNLIANKPGSLSNGPKIMLSAHMDEIGMMVSTLCDNGFVKFARVGGINPKNILGQEVIIHGRQSGKKIYGVIGIKPPHLTSQEDRKKIIEISDMAIDTGYSKEKLEGMVKPGDIITFKQDLVELQNGKISGRALDNTAGLAVLYCVMKNLENFNHKADIYFVASAQEEVGLKGAITAAYNIKPDIGIAIDVTFGSGGGVPEKDSSKLGKGAALCVGPNINRKLFDSLKKAAVKNNTKYQVEVEAMMTGTDAAAIQISEGGVITALVSIPLDYMHSTVEVVSLSDIESCGKIISDYIIELKDWEAELCY